MNDKEKFIALLGSEKLKKAEAIILFEGDGLFRCQHAADLYRQGWSKKIVISGDTTNLGYGSYPTIYLLPELLKLGVAKKDILIDRDSINTLDQAVNILKLAKQKKWKRIILVASHYHQYRAFLTFLQELQGKKLKIELINSPADDLPWFSKNKWGRRIDLLESEFEKIEKYGQDGHVASFAEAIKYFSLKEKRK